MAPQKRVKGM